MSVDVLPCLWIVVEKLGGRDPDGRSVLFKELGCLERQLTPQRVIYSRKDRNTPKDWPGERAKRMEEEPVEDGAESVQANLHIVIV